MKKINYLLFAVLLLASCASKQNTFEAAAKELCDCMKPMYELTEQIKGLSDAGKADEANAMIAKLQTISVQTDQCATDLDQKYAIATEDEAAANEALRKACPEIVAMMEGN